MSQLARQIPIADELRRYGIALVLATHPEQRAGHRDDRAVRPLRSQPRGAQAIILAAKIRAILDHRYHVAREDIRAVAPAVLRHRLILNFEGQAEGHLRPTTWSRQPGSRSKQPAWQRESNGK